VSYGKKAVGFTKLPVDFKSGDTVTLTAAVNGKVITVVELDKDNNVVALVLCTCNKASLIEVITWRLELLRLNWSKQD